MGGPLLYVRPAGSNLRDTEIDQRSESEASMNKTIRKFLTAAALASFALTAAPASAGYYIVYWIDYVGGAYAGYEFYCQNGELAAEWGDKTAISSLEQGDPYFPC